MAQSVIVGLSGGVDSALTAWLLKEQGYRVEAVFMRNWDDDGGKYCTAQQDFLDACRVAKHLDIKLTAINFSELYKERVFAECLHMLTHGMTPNPDVWCNSRVKFGAFLDYVEGKADYLATGHYARLRRDENGIMHMFRAVDQGKDQSYFLHQLNQRQLGLSLFPLGNWTKAEVRAKAKEIGLPNYNRPDSTGICFIGERPFTEFLLEHLPQEPGEMVDPYGRVVGMHQGLAFYTIGQRKGLKIGGSKQGNGKAWYVADKDLEHNRLVVVQGENHPLLFRKDVWVEPVHFISEQISQQMLVQHTFLATIRYRQAPQPCTVATQKDTKSSAGALMLRFARSQRSVTPGQFVALYTGDECVGGGVIHSFLSLETH